MYPGAICHANVAQQFQILGSKGFFGMPEYAAPTELEKLFGGAFTTKIALLRSWKAAALMSSVQKASVFHSTKNSEEPGNIGYIVECQWFNRQHLVLRCFRWNANGWKPNLYGLH